MTHFMAYVILLSAAACAAAIVAEFMLRARSGSTRWLWVGALGAVFVIAGVATFAPLAVTETPFREVRSVNVDGVTASPITVVVPTEARADAVLRITDALLPTAWAIASAILLIAILFGQRRLARERRASDPVTVQGREVLLTESVGPAVAGLSRPFVLLPRWALALDPASQELLLAHEFEHVQRGDTRVLLAGAVAVALMPLNPVVWWISRRLRLAVERDCDARVLAAHPNVRRYADLLLTAASRHGVSTRLLAAHFGEYHSDLEARIQTMTDRKLKWGPTVSAALVAVVLIVASCEAPRPEPLAPGANQKTRAAVVSPTDVLFEYQVEKPVTMAEESETPRYPELTAGNLVNIEGKKLAYTLRRDGDATELPNVVVYAFDGTELARSERDANLLRKIEPNTIHSIEVFKPRSCPATMTCPLIKIRLAKDQSLGAQTLLRPPRDENESELPVREVETRVPYVIQAVSPKMNLELLSSSGVVLARYASREAYYGKMNSEDLSASRTYSAKECAALTGVACPLTRNWLKPGRESAYPKR